MKNKILSHFDVIKSYVEDNIIEACCIIAIVVVLIGVLIGTGSLSVHAAGITNEITPPETIPLQTGYFHLPSETIGFRFYSNSQLINTDAFYVLTFLQEFSTTDAPFRYRFHGSDAINYITGFTLDEVSDDGFVVYASDGFLPRALFASVSVVDNMLSITFNDVDFVCVTNSINEGDLFNFYVLFISGLCAPIEYFIDYGSGGGGTTPACPTLPEMLADYTGSFESIVDMLNTKNYDEYDSWVNEVAQDARDAGKQEGLQEGFLIGKDAGYMDGEVDGFQDGYNKGTSDALVKGFFANFFGGIIEAFEKVEFYNDGSLVINFWTIFCSVLILSVIIILLKVWRGG